MIDATDNSLARSVNKSQHCQEPVMECSTPIPPSLFICLTSSDAAALPFFSFKMKGSSLGRTLHDCNGACKLTNFQSVHGGRSSQKRRTVVRLPE